MNIPGRSLLIGASATVVAALADQATAQEPGKTEEKTTPSQPAPSPTPNLWTKHGASESLLYTTVMLNTVDAHGNKRSGTASIIQLFSSHDSGVHVLLTNKHVVANLYLSQSASLARSRTVHRIRATRRTFLSMTCRTGWATPTRLLT
jgi:hypothetical protein